MINKKHTLYTHVFSVVLWCVFTFWVPCNDVHYDFCMKKRCSVRLYLQLFVGGLMSYLRYLCLFVYIGVQHILCCVFVLFSFTTCKFLWIVDFWLPLRCSLTLIIIEIQGVGKVMSLFGIQHHQFLFRKCQI